MAGSEAWKIKQAAHFPYMDFAPDLYLGCVSITRSAGGSLAFDGGGEIVEWAVQWLVDQTPGGVSSVTLQRVSLEHAYLEAMHEQELRSEIPGARINWRIGAHAGLTLSSH